MSIKADTWIRYMAEEWKMITPFVDRQISSDMISFGLSSCGYDIRLANEFKFCDNPNFPFDPKHPNEKMWSTSVVSDWFVLAPHDFVLARSVERFKIPRDVLAVCVGKSTYARLGVLVNVTPLEPEWEGYLTLEISNTTNNSVYLYPNEGIAQILFFESDEVCEVSYADRKGKYQNQIGVTIAKI